MAIIQEGCPAYLEADVCVLGAAGAGLSAAVRAAELGAKVVVLEKTPRMGGTTRMCGGLFALGTELQRQNGYEYSIDDCWRYFMDSNHWDCNSRLVRQWFKGTNASMEWLASKGVDFVRLEAFSGTTKSHHIVADRRSGNHIVEAMIAELERMEVPIYLNTRAKKLLTDETGAVCGVLADGTAGEVRVKAGAVILCTGSISSNQALLKRFYAGENMEHVKIMAQIPHNTGDGLLMAEEVGAGTSDISTMYIGPQCHDFSMRASLIVRRPEVIKVNKHGDRFADEAMPLTRDWGWFFSKAVDRQPDKTVFGIFDQSILEYFVEHRRNYNYNEDFQGNVMQKDALQATQEGGQAEFREGDNTAWLLDIPADLDEQAAAGIVLKTDSLAEMAAWIGTSEKKLRQTIEDYNAFCRAGRDEDFLKDKDYLMPIVKAPYYCMKSYTGIDTCIGGLAIDHTLHVVTPSGDPIANLYAAGVVASGWLSRDYGYFGSELSFTIYSARTAAENAVKSIKG